MKLALIQITSRADMAENIRRVEALVEKAARKGAEFVATPENAFFMGEGAPKYTQDKHPGVKAAAAMAKKNRVWLLVGSVGVLSSPRRGEVGRGALDERSSDKRPHPNPPPMGEGKFFNRSLLFNPQGKIAASYDKIHLFDVEVGDGQVYRESAKIVAGNKIVVAKIVTRVQSSEFSKKHKLNSELRSLTTRLGMSVCYDLRFPQLYRALAKQGAEILAVPAAFTKVTGEAHWHVLLRARAIENGCFVIAPAQTGIHPGRRRTYGHSLVVNPWGEVIADGGTKEGVVIAKLDLSEVKKARGRIPSLQHDRQW